MCQNSVRGRADEKGPFSAARTCTTFRSVVPDLGHSPHHDSVSSSKTPTKQRLDVHATAGPIHPSRLDSHAALALSVAPLSGSHFLTKGDFFETRCASLTSRRV